MQVDLKQISPLVRQQFPAFYQEEGENFVQFVKAYYEWMDQQGPIYKSRRLMEYTDIDETTNDYVDFFLNKFMPGIPKNVAVNKKLLEKHILDVYRSKGSVEGIKLLFRLLYNIDAEVYTPKVDIFKPSDGKWVRNKYIEVEERPLNYTYNKKVIRGTTSGASAFVTAATKVNTGYQVVNVLYVTDITPSKLGTNFIVGEQIVYDGMDIQDATYIKGSASGASVIYSSEDHAIGDYLLSANTTGEGIKFTVNSLLPYNESSGYISFKLVDGGYGYSMDSPISITYGTATQGSGANFKIKSISNTETFSYNINYLGSFGSTLISANDYGVGMYFANSDSIIGNALTNDSVVVGKISALTGVTSGDHQYDGTLNVSISDNRIKGYGILDSKGKVWGNNAVITGELSFANGVINGVELASSGFGYNTEGEAIDFYNESDNAKTAQLVLTIGPIGYEEGYWADDNSFASADKYITDSDYYQDFSYEIQVEKSLDKYINVLKQVMHPVGNRVFGKPVITDSKQSDEFIQVETLVVRS